MIAVSGVDGKIEFREERRGEVHGNFADFSAAKVTLGFTPNTWRKAFWLHGIGFSRMRRLFRLFRP